MMKVMKISNPKEDYTWETYKWYNAYYLHFHDGSIDWYDSRRSIGRSVRAVFR